MSEDARHIRLALWVRRVVNAEVMRRAVAGPGEGFTARDWVVVFQRVRREAKEDNLGLIAAGVAFWAILSIVPLLVGLMAVAALVEGPVRIRHQLGPLAAILPRPVARSMTGQLSDAAAAMSGQGQTLGLVIGLLGVLWTCSRAIGAVISGLHVVIDETETRGVVQRRAVAFALAAGAVATALAALALVAAVPHVGLGDADRVLGFGVRCLLLAVLAVIGLILLYRYGPDRETADWHTVRWGAGIAMTCWLVTSAGLAAYVARTGGHSSTYGTLAGAAAVATWLYLSSYIVLLGAEINAEIERVLARREVLRELPAESGTARPEEPVPATGTRHDKPDESGPATPRPGPKEPVPATGTHKPDAAPGPEVAVPATETHEPGQSRPGTPRPASVPGSR